MQPAIRRLLTVLVDATVEQPQWVLAPRTMAVAELLQRLRAPDARGTAAPSTPAPVADDSSLLLFDWFGRALPRDLCAAQVPQPGIVVGVCPAGAAAAGIARQAEIDQWLFRQSLLRDKTSADRLHRYLASPDATVAPEPMKTIDVFVSYSFEDGALAADVVRALAARKLQAFLAESSLNAGRPWREQLRAAVLASRRAALLLTPSSLRSAWVLAEAGALASQRTPTVVLLDRIGRRALPAPLRACASTIAAAAQPAQWLDALDPHSAGTP